MGNHFTFTLPSCVTAGHKVTPRRDCIDRCVAIGLGLQRVWWASWVLLSDGVNCVWLAGWLARREEGGGHCLHCVFVLLLLLSHALPLTLPLQCFSVWSHTPHPGATRHTTSKAWWAGRAADLYPLAKGLCTIALWGWGMRLGSCYSRTECCLTRLQLAYSGTQLCGVPSGASCVLLCPHLFWLQAL